MVEARLPFGILRKAFRSDRCTCIFAMGELSESPHVAESASRAERAAWLQAEGNARPYRSGLVPTNLSCLPLGRRLRSNPPVQIKIERGAGIWLLHVAAPAVVIRRRLYLSGPRFDSGECSQPWKSGGPQIECNAPEPKRKIEFVSRGSLSTMRPPIDAALKVLQGSCQVGQALWLGDVMGAQARGSDWLTMTPKHMRQ